MKEKDLHTKQKDELKKTIASSTDKQDLNLGKKEKQSRGNRIDVANEERMRDISKGRP
jgi:hypothetical protein